MGRRLLLTGAGGFVGRHALPRLIESGYEVHCIGRRPCPGLDAAAVWHQADLLDQVGAAATIADIGADYLLHLAWYVTPGSFWTAPENTEWVAASLALYRAFVQGGGRRVVVAGTCAEYDWSQPLLDEAATACLPNTLYGASKHGLHQVLHAAARQDRISLAWARIFFTYGPYEARARLVPDVVLSLLEGRPALCGNGVSRRDLMHVADVAGALVAILNSEFQGPVNVASGECLPLRDVISALALRVGRPDLVHFGARPSSPDDPPVVAAAITALRDGIGFQPAFTLSDGLSHTVDWWRSQARPG